MPQKSDTKNPIMNGFNTKMLTFSTTFSLSSLASSNTTRWQLQGGGTEALVLPWSFQGTNDGEYPSLNCDWMTLFFDLARELFWFTFEGVSLQLGTFTSSLSCLIIFSVFLWIRRTHVISLLYRVGNNKLVILYVFFNVQRLPRWIYDTIIFLNIVSVIFIYSNGMDIFIVFHSPWFYLFEIYCPRKFV